MAHWCKDRLRSPLNQRGATTVWFDEASLGLLGDDRLRARATVVGKILVLHVVWALLMWMVWDEAILVEAVLVLVKSMF